MQAWITTRWYAWVVWLIAFILTAVILSGVQVGSPAAGALVLYLILAAAGIVIFVTWNGAVIELGSQRAWGWSGEVAIRPTTA